MTMPAACAPVCCQRNDSNRLFFVLGLAAVESTAIAGWGQAFISRSALPRKHCLDESLRHLSPARITRSQAELTGCETLDQTKVGYPI